MSEYVKVNKSDLNKLIDAALDAHDLLDNVHCYDTDTYVKLGEALDNIEFKDIE